MDVRMPDGTIVRNVPEGTTQEELMRRYSAKETGAPKSQATVPYFRGMSMAFPPSEEEASSGKRITSEIFRGTLADAASAPLQLAAGAGDLLDAFARKVSGAAPPSMYATRKVSEARNILAGRPGEEPGPATPFVQGLATAPVVGPKITGSVIQALGLTPSTLQSGEDPLREAGKSAATALLMHNLGLIGGKRKPTSQAEARLDDIARREGVDRTYGMKTGSDIARNMEARAERNVLLGGFGMPNMAQSTHDAIDDQFASALWKRAGQDFKEFTQENINTATRVLGNKINAPFAGSKEIPFGGLRLKSAIDDAINSTYDMTRPDEVLKAAFLLDKKTSLGKINSKEFNTVAADIRDLARKAYEDPNSGAGDLIMKMYHAMRDDIMQQIPTQQGKDEYRKALLEYANLQIIKDVFGRSADSARGNIDYAKIRQSIRRNMPGGYETGRADLTDLADLGSSMRRSDVINEGLKANPVDAILYGALNNPLSRIVRERSPVNQESAVNLLRAAGLQLGTEY